MPSTCGKRRRRYFLRKYKRGIRQEEIEFEHSLINHLAAAGQPPVARLHCTREGKTYLQRRETDEDLQGIFYAIFDFLEDEDRYTWVGPRCTPAELAASAAVLAQFHKGVSGFKPQGRRAEPKILELLPVIASTLATCPGQSKGTVFDAYLIENLELVQSSLADTQAAISTPEALALPQTIIHCDYHPGNLKFRGPQVTGLFDFDWSKLDLRAFDVALAIWYFSTTWEDPDDGELRLDEVEAFLRAYQETFQDSPSGSRAEYGPAVLGPLSAAEGRCLPALINASNLYVLNWTILDFYSKDVDPQEYLAFLAHSINFTRWYENAGGRRALQQVIAPLTGNTA
jgi:homoserine kinase type II